jgi:hypothetical protein
LEAIRFCREDRDVSDLQGSSIVLADFDIAGSVIGVSHPVFNPGKVEPSMLIFGQTGDVIGSYGPSDLAAVMTWNGKYLAEDTWNLNLASLKPNTNISGFLLYSDWTASVNEKIPSDPYFILSVGNGSQVPEPGLPLLLALGLASVGAFRLWTKK